MLLTAVSEPKNASIIRPITFIAIPADATIRGSNLSDNLPAIGEKIAMIKVEQKESCLLPVVSALLLTAIQMSRIYASVAL